MKQGFCTFQTGDGRRARELLDEVVAALEPGPDRARALISLARVRSYDDDLRAAEALFRQALAEAEGDDDILAGAGENLASILFRLRERLEEAVEHTAAAERAARAAGNTGWLAEALGGAPDGAGRARAGRTRRLRPWSAALAIQEACRDQRALAQPLFQVAVVWLWWDELERAKEAFERLASARARDGRRGLASVRARALRPGRVRAGRLRARRPPRRRGLRSWPSRAARPRSARTCSRCGLPHTRTRARPTAARARGGHALELADRTSGRPAEHFARGALGLVELSVGTGRPRRRTRSGRSWSSCAGSGSSSPARHGWCPTRSRR